MPDFDSYFQSAVAAQAAQAPADAPTGDAQPSQLESEAQAPDPLGEGNPGEPEPQQQDEDQEEQEQEGQEEGQEPGGGDLKKALSSERYKARQAREALRETQAQLAQAQAQAAQLQNLQQQMAQLQAERQQAATVNAQAEAAARAQQFMDMGDVEGANAVWQQFTQQQIQQAQASALAQAQQAQQQAAQAQALAHLTAQAARLQAQHGQAYTETMAWANSEQSPLRPVMDDVGMRLLDGSLTPEAYYQLAAALKRGMAMDEAAIEREVRRRLASAQVTGGNPAQARTPRLGSLPGGVGSTTPVPAQVGNPQALQQVKPGSGFGSYLSAAKQALG